MPEGQADLFTPTKEGVNTKHIYTVSEITQDIKIILENTFERVWVEGEVSNFNPHPSGHYYFSLKDEKALLSATIFSAVNKDIKFKIENGLKIICFGKIQVYPPHGKYQLNVEKIEPKGIGSLQLALEQLKQRLEKEGLFSTKHKRPIPYLPKRIGVVTSASGAAIKDILKVLEGRFKETQIIINPVRVQGEGAKEEIARAVNDFNSYNRQLPLSGRIEVLIVGRGGGSIEDLWAFNEEIVARAIYDSAIPVISAVGHERDWTIADLVADLRAPTPSAAAEQVIPRKEELQAKVNGLLGDLNRNVGHIWELESSELQNLVKKLTILNPVNLVGQYKNRVNDLAKQIYVRASHFLKLRESEFFNLAQKMSSLNPLNILSRGFSVTFSLPKEEILKDASIVGVGDSIKTRLSQGELISKVTEVRTNG